MNEIMDNFTWTHQLECPPTICNDSVKKILSKGVLELLWEDISNCTFPAAEACKIRKNILLYKLKHELNDPTLVAIKDLCQLRSKSNTVKDQVSMLEKNYEEQDYIVRQKIQQLKEIKTKCSMVGRRKDFLKLKYNETNKQLKDCSDMRRICQHLMPNTSKDLDQGKLRDSLDVVTSLRSTADKKQVVWRKVSDSLGSIDTHILWTQLYQTLSQDLDRLMKVETKNELTNTNVVGENIDIGIAKACGQYICNISKHVLSDAKANKYQQHVMEFIEQIELVSDKDVSEWLVLALEVKKLEVEQACLQNELQILKDNIQNNSLLNLDIAQLTTGIEKIDLEMDGYVKNIQQSIAVLNSTASLISKAKEKLHHELQKIVALQGDYYDPKLLDNSLDIELDIFYNNLDLNVLRRVMLKGEVKRYRHAICGLNEVSITVTNPQCSKVKLYFPMIQMPIYTLIECYKNMIANMIYTKLQYSMSMENVEYVSKTVPLREKCDYNSLELLNLSKVTCNQAWEEIERCNEILNSWTTQDVQEAMVLNEKTVDDVSFKDWLQRYNLLLYLIQNTK